MRRQKMRLGGPIFSNPQGPDEWVAAVRLAGYSTVSAPVGVKTPSVEVAAYRKAAEAANIVIAEVGAWSNPISRDSGERAKAMDLCQRNLALAEEVGAKCCVNIAGSRGERWDGPDPENDSPE